MKPLKIITIFFFFAYPHIGLPETNLLVSNQPCHTTVNSNIPQYIVGYGSLIQNESKNKTYPHTGMNIPVIIDGYRRGWFQKGIPIGFSATFLGVVHDKKSQFNGVIFKLSAGGMAKYDEREMGYCRETISPKHIKILTRQTIPAGQFWIYVSQPAKIAKASSKYPITQSYVDIFLSGCLEIQKNYHLKNFTQDCVLTTHDWSTAWVNDRIYPRRALAYQPNAMEIDQILAEKMPLIFNKIKLERPC